MSAHTKGPWTHYDDEPGSFRGRHEIHAHGKTIARIYCTRGDEVEDAANARLIACAPDLLEALKAALDSIVELEAYCNTPDVKNDPVWRRVRANGARTLRLIAPAIAKAEGTP